MPGRQGLATIETPQWERFFSVSLETAMALFDSLGDAEPARGVEMVRELASTLLPPQGVAGLDPEVAWLSLPVEQVGGDFHDLISGAARTYVMIGDVSGSGPLTALFMAMTTCLFRILAPDGVAPGEMLQLANRILYPHLKRRGSLITAQVACFDHRERRLAIASAGHLWPYMMKDGRFAEVELDGLPLGALPELAACEVTLPVNSGDRMVFYTDGLVECTNRSGEMFGFDRVAGALGKETGTSAQGLIDAVMMRFREFVREGGRRDDVSVIALAWTR